MSVVSSSTNAQGPNARQSARQTRTNPSRTSKTLGRSSFAYGHGSMIETPPAPTPHGFYPALTHFTDAITALPREFRRHNSLLKEVDAKAWALEDNLLQLLKMSSESQPVACPPNPAPIVDGAVREDLVLAVPPQTPESQDSKNRRLLFDRVRRTLVDLMMTADEKNHVISNANDELDRQLLRTDGIFPFIAGEISEESRLGSLTHWAYSNRNAAKTVTNERPRRETASNKQDFAHGGHEGEGSHRGDARREGARKQRRTHADSDFDDARASGSRKGQAGKSRGGAGTAPSEQPAVGAQGSGAGTSGATKRRKVERPPPVDTGVAVMERSASGTGNASARGASKDATGDATKKRSRAPNPNAASRKRNNTGASAANSPILAPAPLAGTTSLVRNAASPGPGAVRPQSSHAQQSSGPSANSRQRPSSSASNRLANTNKSTDLKATPKETPKAEAVPAPGIPDTQRRDTGAENAATAAAKIPAPVSMKREDTEIRPTESVESRETPLPLAANPAPKGRNSKTSTPVLSTFSEANTQRTRPTRNTEPAPAKRSHKKNGSVAVVQARAVSEEEESLHEGDDEDEDGEPRYCYCNEISFGEMVACDNDACPREWFHLSCVGLTKPPGKNVKWYCNECKENMRRSRNGR
ncbi:putative PHD finger domain protein (Ing1) [Aspergillus clavatus NRRL 1]|uniref:Chromatin modification-related protein n=1 Tax=Aspergillus clavatus (strain ATCC 1007 / CBS 513.65 / DSM 816 / NCTC 3887 / NRRL 1 / QM 1276 / 107) TaxID=344612 RepID=A1CI96_ASPCL|nr:PHD finger domain protein [Aspergillus clavatus NRRL 1]EAW10601.1 PHD finger domain protein [Aspergillus clavatus NRRL 1]